jgi:predicted secreted Zn-dependent protease
MARKIDDDLIHLPGMNSCPELEAFADAQSQLSLERLKEQSRQYDLETGHGRTQGVWVDY